MVANALMFVASLLLAAALAEGLLRFALGPERLIPSAPETPALNERGNALRFYVRQQERKTFGGHDPWLGWDAGHPETRVRGRSSIAAPAAGQLRVVALGDSFTWGNEVAAEENFAHLLDVADNGLQVLNMGVPGYGIDQMVLKYERHGAQLNPDLVILGVYVSDYERSTVGFTAAAKPLFKVAGDGLELSNTPLPEPQEVIETVGRGLQGQFYLTEFVSSRLPGARQPEAQFFDQADALIERLLRRLQRGLSAHQRLLILHIPRGESFVDPDRFHQEMANRLRGIYATLSLGVVDLRQVLTASSPPEAIPERFYRVRESGSIGHLSPAGHAAAARALTREINRR